MHALTIPIDTMTDIKSEACAFAGIPMEYKEAKNRTAFGLVS